jgi:drug/metabolite transporter (DMT)-like permease
MRKQKVILPIAALTLASVFWGADAVFIKIGVATIPATIFLAIRFFAASMIVLPLAIRNWRPINLKNFLLISLGSVFYVSLSSLALYIGLQKTTAINFAIIYMLQPLILLVLSVSFLKERIDVRTFLGICIALMGSLIIIGRPWSGGGSNSELIGNLLIVIAVFCVCIGTLICKPLTKKMSSQQLTFLYMFPGILPVAVYALKQFHTWNIASTTTASWWSLAGSTSAVVCADLLFFFALRYKKAMDVGIYQYVESVVTIIVAWFLLAERPSPGFILGALLVFAGVCLAEFSNMRKRISFK